MPKTVFGGQVLLPDPMAPRKPELLETSTGLVTSSLAGAPRRVTGGLW